MGCFNSSEKQAKDAGAQKDAKAQKGAAAKKPEAKEGKTAAERKAAWEKIREKLPRKKTLEDKQRRAKLFAEFDKDGSKSLTLEEVYTGCVEILHLDEFTTRLRVIVKRAFNQAKDMGTKDRDAGEEDKVEFLEFRLMLCYIYDYFQLTVMFDEIDSSGDGFIEKDEFRKAKDKVAEWGLTLEDPDKTFGEIDDNNSGKITFDEFAAWALQQKLKADGDPDQEL